MAKLLISSFSCIDQAEISLSKLTVLIGPQASGKSIISKMIYFFYDIIIDQDAYITRHIAPSKLAEEICEAFKKAFPPQTWGNLPFSVEFAADTTIFKFERSKPRKGSIGKLRLAIADFFVEEYKRQYDEVTKIRSSQETEKTGIRERSEYEIIWRIRQKSIDRLKLRLNDNYIGSQLFIPAGRSFFTSIGKAMMAFEHGGFFDPLTIRFGRLFMSLRDRHGRAVYAVRERQSKDVLAARESLGAELFGGVVRMEPNEEFIETSDGRKVPFALLSSGQQELIPLWMTFYYLVDIVGRDQLIYIEEPEAHLFPNAQTALVNYITSSINRLRNQSVLITTHSPYILSVMNNLLKAGAMSVGHSKKDLSKIEAIIPRSSWLLPGSTSAYAIIDRRVVPIVEDDGLINGEYLDQVSNEIARIFTELLEVEIEL